MSELLKVKNLSVQFPTDKGTVYAVKDFSLNLNPGEIMGIVGESGSGKSTAAYAIMDLLQGARVTAGEISFQGRDMLSMSGEEKRSLRGGQVGMIFQDPMGCLDPSVKIEGQMVEMLRQHSNVTKGEARKISTEMLRSVGITDPEGVMKGYQHQLSGGMRQRVMIAMMLSTQPKLLIADEPTTALDVTIQDQILELLTKTCRENHMAMLFITHNFGIVARICNRVSVMYGGMIVEEGLSEDIFYSPGHPYTRGLLEAIPDLEPGAGRRLKTISGTPNDPFAPPSGCVFAPRCPDCTGICKTEIPKRQDMGGGHGVWCHLARQEGRKGE